MLGKNLGNQSKLNREQRTVIEFDRTNAYNKKEKNQIAKHKLKFRRERKRDTETKIKFENNAKNQTVDFQKVEKLHTPMLSVVNAVELLLYGYRCYPI